MERFTDEEKFSRKDIEILRGLSKGRDLDKMLDRADLEGHEYRLNDLRRLRNLAGELGFNEVIDLIPLPDLQAQKNILKQLREAREKHGGRVSRRMGMERTSSMIKEYNLEIHGDANIEFIRKIGFTLGKNLKELFSGQDED